MTKAPEEVDRMTPTPASKQQRRLVLGPVALALLALVLGPAAAGAADGEDGALLPTLFPAVGTGMKDLPPFFRDTQLLLQLRSYYRNNEASPDTYQEAWATGGWLAYRSGWLADTFAIGVTGYLSLPFYAPDDRDGTLLLQPGQNTIAVVGEAWAKLRYQEQVLSGGRRLIDVDYVNPQDNRMIPNTFEAVLLEGKLGWLGYTAGYVFSIKPREENVFISMTERAGAGGDGRGLALVGFVANPWKPLAIDLSTAFGVDTFNTAFVQAEYTRPLAKDVVLTVGAQYTDQRSVGDERLGTFDTWNVGAHARLAFWGASVDVMFHQTGDGADIRTPYGTWPGYLSLINKDFDRANETAFGVKVTYDFARLGVPGLTAFFWFAQGTGADNTSTGGPAPDRREYDFDVTYTVQGGPLRGFQFKARTALVEQQGTPGLLPDIRLILNWPIRLL
jgi:outer membrane porin, OprD family